MTATSTHETEITLDPDVPLVRITREFDAPPAKVFRAHTDPELVVQWLGPRGLQMRIDHYDCRTGGSYRYLHSSDDEEYAFRGTFHEVRPDELIVQTFTFEGMPDAVALEKLVLTDLGDGRTRLTGTSLVDSFADRDAFVASGMETGIREGYERLDELLARPLTARRLGGRRQGRSSRSSTQRSARRAFGQSPTRMRLPGPSGRVVYNR